jgi:uncharacterized coiled-coil DUF342 family protein
VQELFENVLSEEMKELYRQVQEMMEKLEQGRAPGAAARDEAGSGGHREGAGPRAWSTFKRLEVEQKAEDIAKQLEDLAKKQEELSEKTKEGKADQEELKKEQDELNKEMEELRKEMDEPGEEERRPWKTHGPAQDGRTGGTASRNEQEKSSEQLEKKQNQKASESQKKAAEQMEQLAFQMQSAMQSNAQKSSRKRTWTPCGNCWRTSYSSASIKNRLMEEATATSVRDPRFVRTWAHAKASCAMMPR